MSERALCGRCPVHAINRLHAKGRMQLHSYFVKSGLPRVLTGWLNPIPGESLRSYIDRLAAKYRLSIGEMLSHLRLVTSIHPRGLPGFGIYLADDRVTALESITRVPAATWRSMVLTHYHDLALNLANVGSSPDATRKAAANEWAYFSGSHCCPQCLAENGGAWLLAWKLPWSFCCLRHKALLLDTCPSCGIRAGRGLRDGALSPAFHARIPQPGMCANALPSGQSRQGKAGAPCGADLNAVPQPDVADCHALLEHQRRLDMLLAVERGSPDARVAKTYFQELRSICALILYAAEPDDLPTLAQEPTLRFREHVAARNAKQTARQISLDPRKGPRTRTYIGAPTDATLLAAVVPAAMRIVDSSTEEDLGVRLGKLAMRVRARSGRARWAVADYFRLTGRLRVAFEEGLAAFGTFDRRAGARSSRTAKRANSYAFEARHVPQLLPPLMFDSVAPLFAGIQDNFARRFCAMSLVKLLGTTWAEAAKHLELPASMIRFANRAVTLLNTRGNTDVFTEALHGWADSLSSQSNRIDYSLRRQTLSLFRDIPRADWRALCDEAGIATGERGSRSKYAAAWLWAELTDGDWRLSPAIATHCRGTHQHDGYRNFIKTCRNALAPHLLAYGDALVANEVS